MSQPTIPLNNLSRNLVRYFGAMLVVLLTLLSFALWNFHRLAEADGWKAHTYQVLLQSQRLKEDLFLIDSSMRGFIVSGSPRDGDMYEQAQIDYRQNMSELRLLVSDNPSQLWVLQKAAKAKEAYMRIADNVLANRLLTDSLQQSAIKLSKSAAARRSALNGARSTLGDFENTEKGLLASRIREQDHWQHLTEITLWIGSGFSILLTLFLSSVSVRAVRESSSAYARLRESNEQLASAISQLQSTKHGLEIEVAQRRDAEERLRRAVGDLKRSNGELEQFAYVASHDLQEPLRAVAGCVQVLKRRYEGQLDERADQFIGHAVEGAQRMQNLIHDLLSYSRVGTKGKPFVDVSLEKVLDATLQSLSACISESNASIVRAPLPTLRGDATQLEQVFQNLVSNAIKFRGDEAPRVEIGCVQTRDEAQGEGWIFSVSDCGPGIEAQYFERIFVMFQRLHTRAEYPGTGIGLAIVKKIIERHGGRIWVESEVGRGTTFSFFLPSSVPDNRIHLDDIVQTDANVEHENGQQPFADKERAVAAPARV